MIAGIEDGVLDRFARLQDRTDKPLELTGSGPDPDRRTLTRLRAAARIGRWCGSRRTPVARSATATPHDSSTTSWPTPLTD
jgi:hypothetical protein